MFALIRSRRLSATFSLVQEGFLHINANSCACAFYLQHGIGAWYTGYLSSQRLTNFLMRLLLPLSILKFALFTIARIVNVTIDDTYGDELTGAMPDYGSDCTHGFPPCDPDCGPGCSRDCEHGPLLDPDAYHTCMDGGFGSRILFDFEVYVIVKLHCWLHQTTPRSAIYLYHHANAAVGMYAVIAIDGIVQTNYSWAVQEDAYAWWWYNVSLFSKTDLSAGKHNVTIESSRILFDFANYRWELIYLKVSDSLNRGGGSTEIPDTPDTSSSMLISTAASVSSTSSSPAPSTSSRRNLAGPIAGGIIGGFVLLIVLFATVLWVRRRQDTRQADAIRIGREMSEPVDG